MNTRSDDAQVAVIGGADTHRATHHAVALNNLGLVLGDKEFPATTAGYRGLLEWKLVWRGGTHRRGVDRLLRGRADALPERTACG